MKNIDRGLLTLMTGIVCWAVLVFILVTATGCGGTIKVKGGTQNNVNADAKVTLVLKLDLAVCEEFGTAAKLDCIEAMAGAFESLGDLSKVLVCDPAKPAQCQILSQILDGVK